MVELNMRLKAPCKAVDFEAYDINGKLFRLSANKKVIILSFFRDAACPFCNVRVYEYTKRYEEWAKLGIEVVAVFTSPPREVKKIRSQKPSPFCYLWRS